MKDTTHKSTQQKYTAGNGRHSGEQLTQKNILKAMEERVESRRSQKDVSDNGKKILQKMADISYNRTHQNILQKITDTEENRT